MSWLSRDAWIDATGVLGTDLRTPCDERARAQAAELGAIVAFDPRRLAAIVGTSAIEMARLAGEVVADAPLALWPDPRPLPDPDTAIAELARRVAEVPDDVRPVVVLDGPLPEETALLFPGLIGRPIHPRLLVLAPCDQHRVERMTAILGGYPKSSILVASVTEEDPAPPSGGRVGVGGATPLALALAGRCPAGTVDGEAELLERGLAARDEDSATLLCLAGDAARRALVDEQILSAPDGARRLEQLLAGAPALRWRALVSLVGWTGGEIPEPLLPALVAFDAADFPTLDEPLWRGLRPAPPVTRALDQRAEALLAGEDDPDRAASLELYLARSADRGRDRERAKARVRSGLSRQPSAAVEASLLAALAGMTGEPDACARAAKALRAVDDRRGLSRVTYQLVRSLKRLRRIDDAREVCRDLAAIDEADGHAYTAANAHMLSFHLSADGGNELSVDDAERALELHRSIGNVRGQLEALYKIAAAWTKQNRYDAALPVFARALELEQRLSNPRNEAYCHFQLGQCAERTGDPAGAVGHYEAAIAAYEAGGAHPPGRVLHALERARRHTGGASSEA